jgi:hypothetical protein
MSEIIHGTPGGYEAGCKTRPGCPAVMPCKTVWMRHRSDLDFRRRFDAGEALEQIIAGDRAAAVADLVAEKEARRVERAKTHGPRPKTRASAPRQEWTNAEDQALRVHAAAGLSAWAVSEAMGRSPRTVRAHADLLGLTLRDGRAGRTVPAKEPVQGVPVAEYPHGTVEGYEAGCFGVDCPAAPSCAEANLIVHGIIKAPRPQREARERVARVPREKPVVEHGSLTMYLRGCRGDDCPVSPSCREVAIAYYTEHNRSYERKVQPHGTNASYARGCKSDDGCPNFGTTERTCYEAHVVYHAEYRAKRRGAPVPAEKHGAAYGYQLGCAAEATCPASPTCTEATLAAERDRRRRDGVPAREPMVDAGPVREHVRSLIASRMTLDRIAEQAGVHRSQLGNLIYGRSGERGRSGAPMQKVTASRAERIMAVQP